MSNEQILLVLASFCVAFIVFSAINRPRVIIQSERNNETALGCLAALGVLFGLAILVLAFFLSQPAPSPSAPSQPEQAEVPEDGKQVREWSHLVQDTSKPKSNAPRSKTGARVNQFPPFQWVIQIRRFTNEYRAGLFIEELPFPGAQVLLLSNGQFMVALLADSQANAETKLNDLKEKYGTWLPDLKAIRLKVRQNDR